MKQLLRKLFGTRVSAKPTPRRQSVRLTLESLDGRIVPSATVQRLGDITGSAVGNQFLGGTAYVGYSEDLGSDRTVARSTSTGNYAVAWSADDPAHSGIYVRLFRPDNTPLTGAIHVDSTGRYDSEPSIAMNSSGQFAVAWEGPAKYVVDLHVQRFNAIGAHIGAEMLIESNLQLKYQPSVGLDNYGNLMVAYSYQYSGDDYDIHVWSQRASGATSIIRLATGFKSEHAPSLALNDNGTGVVAFESDYSDSDHDIYARRLTTGGASGTAAAIGGNITVVKSGVNQFDPSVAINKTGSFVVSYTEEADYVQGHAIQVFARQFDAANNYRGGIGVGIASDLARESLSSVAMDVAGRYIVAYRHGEGYNPDVLAQVFNSNNTARGAAFNVGAIVGVREEFPTVALGVTDLTSNYSGGGTVASSASYTASGSSFVSTGGSFSTTVGGTYFGQVIFSFQTFGQKRDADGILGYGVSVARAWSL